MTEATKWLPLHEALAHVLRHKRSRKRAKQRLLQVLGKRNAGVRQVRCRACVTFRTLPPERREQDNYELDGDFWDFEYVNFEYEPEPPKIDWDDDSASIPRSHPLGPMKADRIEVAQDDLFAIWPELPGETSKAVLSPGKPRKHVPEVILTEAAVFIHNNGLPETLNDFVTTIRRIFDDKTPGEGPQDTYLKGLLGPLYKRLKQQQ